MSPSQHGKAVPMIVGALLVTSVLLLGFAATDTLAFLEKSEDPGGTGGGCHCGEKLCGCAPPPAGCTLDAYCSCPASGDCTRSCAYHCE